MTPKPAFKMLDSVAGDHVPNPINLAPSIVAKLKRTKTSSIRRRILAFSPLVALLVLSLLIIQTPAAVQAIRQFFGFVPGVGVVDLEAPIRVLAEPVSQTRDGITVAVKRAMLAPDRTVIDYSVESIPPSAYPQHRTGSDPQGFQRPCEETPFLRLADGTRLERSGYNAVSGVVEVAEYELAFTVAPVPPTSQEAVLVMPCLLGVEREAAPEQWELPLRFVPAPEDLAMAPVLDLQTPDPAQAASQPVVVRTDSASSLAGTPAGGITLTVEQVIPLPDGDLVYGSLEWGEEAPYSVLTPDQEYLTDSQGERVPLEMVSPDPALLPSPGSHRMPLAYKVKGPVQHPGPLTLTMEKLIASLHVTGTSFMFDTGPDPQVGQEWLLDQVIEVDGYPIRVRTVTRLSNGYEFTFQNPAEVLCVELVLDGMRTVRGLCGPHQTVLEYDGEVPAGKMTVTVANLDVQLTGSWQASWTP